MPHLDADPIPPSDVSARVGLAGLVGFGGGWGLVLATALPALPATFLLLVATAWPMVALERAANHGRLEIVVRSLLPIGTEASRLAGLVAAAAPFALLHLVLMAEAIGASAAATFVAGLLLCLIAQESRPGAAWRGAPDDDPFRGLGARLCGRAGTPLRNMSEPLRAFALKAFFAPLYLFVLVHLAARMPALLTVWRESAALGLVGALHHLLYGIDLAFAALGYLCVSRRLATAFRSTQPRPFGWFVCLVCYPPLLWLWPAGWLFSFDELGWPARLPLVLSLGWWLWIGTVLGLLALYAWATVAFGLRFSNLADRGLVTHGPYRWMKHPAYAVHVANLWLLYAAFAPGEPPPAQAGGAAVALALTLAYRLRALTEEAHLRAAEPRYTAYAEWIARHGLWARLRRLAPVPRGIAAPT